MVEISIMKDEIVLLWFYILPASGWPEVWMN